MTQARKQSGIVVASENNDITGKARESTRANSMSLRPMVHLGSIRRQLLACRKDPMFPIALRHFRQSFQCEQLATFGRFFIPTRISVWGGGRDIPRINQAVPSPGICRQTILRHACIRHRTNEMGSRLVSKNALGWRKVQINLQATVIINFKTVRKAGSINSLKHYRSTGIYKKNYVSCTCTFRDLWSTNSDSHQVFEIQQVHTSC